MPRALVQSFFGSSLLSIFLGCASGPSEDGMDPRLKAQRGQARLQMERIIAPSAGSVCYFQTHQFVVAGKTSPATAERIRRYSESQLPAMKPFFTAPTRAVKVYVFETAADLLPYVAPICGAETKVPSSMGFYHDASGSVLCSMQWGLGWLGDLLIRSWLAQDWETWGAQPNPWFQPSFVSMLYNCYRTQDGAFHGLNVVSYYRPQAQRLVEEKRIFPLREFFRDTYDRSKVQGDAIRVQGREFLAYLHSRGLLEKFYHAYRETSSTDRSGIRAIETVLNDTLEQIEKEWLAWLMSADGEIGDSEMAKPFPVLGILIRRNAPGVQVLHACPYSPAIRGGIRDGDLIVEINGIAIPTKEKLVELLNTIRIGALVTVTVIRNGARLQLSVTLDRLIDG
ncbi:MAG TPA: PDZ domain-containing protein [Planctomycetota bacterium]|nr:PDZ domain-containing protein [Planctomycetota bacterium]